ncbi:MAG: hypothetical protein IH983_01375 [Planctomycetes bacterium]|nr:hypothetical protein [Planctomycetota bacterium]
MIEKPAAPLHSAAPQRCPTCGYDLRGSASPVCPECGTPRTWRRLRFFDRAQFLEVLKILSDAGVAHRGFDGGSGQALLGQIYMGTSVAREIWIGEPDAERAIKALESEGIAFPLPIVDRAEPACPSCSTPLDPKGSASCPACGTIFQWVQIGEPSIDPTQLHCYECGYDLTGNTSDRCPECGALLPKNLDGLVAAATGDEPAATSSTRSVLRLLITLSLIAGTGSVVMIMIGWPTSPTLLMPHPYLLLLMIVVGAIGIAIGAGAVVKYLRGR